MEPQSLLEGLLALLPRRGEYICPSPEGVRWEIHNFLKAWKATGMAARLPQEDPALLPVHLPDMLLTRPYVLRRTCISLALARGMPPTTAARVFGHQLGTMMRYYVSVNARGAGKYL